MEVVRVSAVDWHNNTVLDLFVMPTQPILCFNTRYSGIDSISNDAIPFHQLHDKLNAVAGSNTIFVGHGLDNDLRALRIRHEKVIDTIALFEHPKGLPFRLKLAHIVNEHLKRFIQTGEHNSVEDAVACMDLLRYLYTKENSA
jgi:RNA exonuclease 1